MGALTSPTERRDIRAELSAIVDSLTATENRILVYVAARILDRRRDAALDVIIGTALAEIEKGLGD